MHDMHNSLFGGLLGGSGTGEKVWILAVLLTDRYIHKSTNQQIQTLIAGIMQNVQQVTIPISIC